MIEPCKHGHVDGVMHIECKDCRIEYLEAELAKMGWDKYGLNIHAHLAAPPVTVEPVDEHTEFQNFLSRKGIASNYLGDGQYGAGLQIACDAWFASRDVSRIPAEPRKAMTETWTDAMYQAAHEALKINNPSHSMDTIVRLVNAAYAAAPKPRKAMTLEQIKGLLDRGGIRYSTLKSCDEIAAIVLVRAVEQFHGIPASPDATDTGSAT